MSYNMHATHFVNVKSNPNQFMTLSNCINETSIEAFRYLDVNSDRFHLRASCFTKRPCKSTSALSEGDRHLPLANPLATPFDFILPLPPN